MRFLKIVLAMAGVALVSQPVATQSVSPRRALAGPILSQPVQPVPESPPPAAPEAAGPVQPADSTAAESPAEGQARADYLAWLARDPAVREQVRAFTQFLQDEGVDGVLPTWQLLRTASMWRDCDGPRFEVAPAAEWKHIAQSLRFIRSHVIPAIGRVEAVSGYRNGELNHCARGAPASAHRHFYALDLVPVRAIGRAGLVRSLCAAHQGRGQGYDTGLGFYNGTRFHIDSKGYRRWGPDGSGATSPCVTEV